MLLKSIRSNKRRALITQLNSIARKELERAMDREVKPTLIKSHNLVVANWKNKPEFQARKFISTERIAVTVFPTGPNAEIYGYVDQGTKPHVITAKNVPFLSFRTGYISKTLAKPARTVSGGGVTTGPRVYAKLVHHPGSEAREFSKTIAEDIEPDFKQIIEKAFRNVSKQLEE